MGIHMTRVKSSSKSALILVSHQHEGKLCHRSCLHLPQPDEWQVTTLSSVFPVLLMTCTLFFQVLACIRTLALGPSADKENMSTVLLDESVSLSSSMQGKACGKAFGSDVSACQQQELTALRAALKKEAADAVAAAKQEVSKAQMEVGVEVEESWIVLGWVRFSCRRRFD